jgi:hypothetical protein
MVFTIPIGSNALNKEKTETKKIINKEKAKKRNGSAFLFILFNLRLHAKTKKTINGSCIRKRTPGTNSTLKEIGMVSNKSNKIL